MPDPIARVFEIGVRLVFDPRVSPGFEIVTQVGSTHLDEWPNHRVAAWKDSAQAGQARASNELEEEGLCLIVACVADGDAVRGH